MQHLEVSGAVRPLKWSLGVKWLTDVNKMVHVLFSLNILLHWTYSGSENLTTLNISAACVTNVTI